MCIRDSHSVEDTGIVMGQALKKALGDFGGLVTVSYTHLDVYKRQVPKSSIAILMPIKRNGSSNL